MSHLQCKTRGWVRTQQPDSREVFRPKLFVQNCAPDSLFARGRKIHFRKQRVNRRRETGASICGEEFGHFSRSVSLDFSVRRQQTDATATAAEQSEKARFTRTGNANERWC